MTRPAIYLCGYDDGSRVTPNPDCPNADQHTPEPPGYVEWHEWAKKMAKTHKQRRCSGCDRWSIWVPVRTPLRVAVDPEEKPDA